MPRFIREIASYVAVAVIAAALTFYLAPAKVVVNTTTIGAAVVPQYAREYMDAICAMDASYLAAHTSPGYADADSIAQFVVAAQEAGWGCGTVKYLGSYQSADKQVFVVIVRPGTPDEHEVFYVLTFEDGLVVEIE